MTAKIFNIAFSKYQAVLIGSLNGKGFKRKVLAGKQELLGIKQMWEGTIEDKRLALSMLESIYNSSHQTPIELEYSGLDDMTDFISKLFTNKVNPQKEKYNIVTGSAGFKLFQKFMNQEYAGMKTHQSDKSPDKEKNP